MNLSFDINTNPTVDNLNEIKSWLLEEHKISNEGFYCNWNLIEKSYENEELLIFQNDDLIIGFITWRNCGIYASLDIMEIKPNYRRKGFGKLFYESVADYYQSIGLIAIKLFCAPITSEKFWKKIGFIKFPNRGYSEPDLTYFISLIDINTPGENDYGNKLELWNLEPYKIKNQKPKWIWKIENENLEFLKPILHPCNGNWNLRLTMNNVIIKESKVKYFSDANNEIEYGPFLYITKLN
ncbi:GNAT family N-acetyltransferase [Flavobacterium supellecticarium]|uniref:GNAT family N-acetyltransferase n=1 Tax=Flavobacterium supellecticarium TaxID=2565924 RepID=A0A4S4A4W2_9FLAO|nr:GNAT family N-acetyltransferase [Flavobacterium supellecticarium]THF52985.1 GNAT family N-acetyltransferase [Flavobacterium supellecticarium]